MTAVRNLNLFWVIEAKVEAKHGRFYLKRRSAKEAAVF